MPPFQLRLFRQSDLKEVTVVICTPFASVVMVAQIGSSTMCRAFFHGIYAIARNGLWDDPAEAVTGTVYTRFQKVVVESRNNEDAAAYLTWRFSYLICHVVFALIWGAASFADWTPNRNTYDQIIAQLPADIQAKRFETFIALMSWWDPFLMYVWCISFVLVLCAVVTAAPALALRCAGISRRLVWFSWLWNFVVPFTVLLIFPLRETIDWTGIQEDLCVVAVSRALASPGIDMSSALGSLQQQGLAGLATLQSAVQQQASQDIKINDVPVRTWCQEQGSNWHSVFCDSVMRCVVMADQRCREEVCDAAPVSEQVICQTRCLDYAQSSQTAAATAFTDSMQSECSDFQRNQSSGQNITAGLGAGIPSECVEAATRQLQLFNALAQQQQVSYEDQCSYASLAVNNVDFVAGMFVGVEAGSLLIPAGLSVLGGLAESLYNVKALFPGHQEVPWMLVITSFEALPIYTAYLAVIQQFVGNWILAVACLSFICWIVLPALTGSLSLKLRPGYEGRWKFYRKVWVEYGLRVPIIIAIFFSMSGFMRDRFGNEFLQGRNPLPMLVFSVLEYFARKTLTAVAGTDAMISGFLQSESWRAGFTDQDKTVNKDRLDTLSSIILSSSKTRACAIADGSDDVKNPRSGQEAISTKGAKSTESLVVSPHQVQEIQELHEVEVHELHEGHQSHEDGVKHLEADSRPSDVGDRTLN
ncbi:unnamed protein product [Symbiodinium natans]|uniref:Uncharacterized protein n=1 Tax=Symbiodinium natans TaxID=878477 RepID=A0A812REF1_9DINO|nr:unnamed protein product [Symbiodinium natans]